MEGELSTAVDSILKARWDLRAGQVIPETEAITLGNSGVTLEATILYADLADSTELALYDQEIAAEVYKAYLLGTSQLIKAAGGEIRSFDGDRVMGIFIGNFKNTSAAIAAIGLATPCREQGRESMSQQSTGPCDENQRMCKLFDDAVAEVCRLRSDQEYAKKIGASDAGELQVALAGARAAGRAVSRSLQDHVEQHGCKA